jgi:hypothetical protein
MQSKMIAVIAVIVIIAVAIAAGLAYYNQPGNSVTINEMCTIVSFAHSYPYNPFNGTTYTYTNTTITSAIETYSQTNIHVLNSSQSVSTATGTTLTASGYPGIYWNETVCTFYSIMPP